ncbi:hypothetical protein PENTCL1PPCAC_10617, partial [Pristionchus entomophagus]
LFLLPFLFSNADSKECFKAEVSLMCGDEYYAGPVVVNLWDNNFFLFGGDEKILAKDYVIKNDVQTIEIKDTRTDCWFYEPYVIFTSYCKKANGYNIFKEWFEFFRAKFFTKKNTLIYSVCRLVPNNSGGEVTIQLADNDEC